MQVHEAWEQHRRWSQLATSQKAALTRWRARALVCLVLGALLGACATRSWLPRELTATIGAVSAALLALTAFIQARLVTAARVQAWVAARATSEALKGVVFQFLTAVAPFTGAQREQVLAAKVAQCEERGRDQAHLLAGVRGDGKALPPVAGIVDYVRDRAQEQRAWHESKVVVHHETARRWRFAELSATALAAVLAAVGGALGADVSAWVAVATTAGAAFAAHVASGEHERLATSYAALTADLTALLRPFDAQRAGPDQAAAFVAAVEARLAVQVDGWASLFPAT
ncbi:DUF4231 domain-containing protein [Kineococcus glutinatus]|uniref:SMODS and SLOG-associating 2TM effector domain-containing protein n=1 Tax=Kineococcus glutinatus TaxID=1070872 RepID=A0ABP9H851_9ACTN